jgi:hypothetical protein
MDEITGNVKELGKVFWVDFSEDVHYNLIGGRY